MSVTRIYAVFMRQLFLIKSSPARLIPIFTWIVIDVVQWGFISKYLGNFGGATFGFVSVILGAIILWGFTSRMNQGVMTSFLEDVWSQNFLNFFASPLKIGEYLTGLALTSITTGAASLLVMIALAGLAFGYNFFKIGFLLFPFMLILFVFGLALGIFMSGIIFRLGPAAEWIGWPIPVVLSIFSGIYYPIATLPGALQWISKIIPASYVFESLRAIIVSGSFSHAVVVNLISGAVLSVVYFLAAYKFFVMIYGRNLRNGLLARFGAESG